MDNHLLKQQIGIDRSVLYEFTVRNIDEDRIRRAIADFRLNEKGKYATFQYSNDSDIVLENGQRLLNLEVRDSRFGRLKVSFVKNNLNGRTYPLAKLELMVSDTSNNIQNLKAEEYKLRVADVFQMLHIEYGIDIDYSTVQIKRLELNATFFLDESYDQYKRAILLLIRNVPPKRYGRNSSNNGVKYACWFEALKESTDLETVIVKNDSVQLKIYNKKKHLLDMGIPIDSDKDVMRIEYTITDATILKNNFGSNLVEVLDDDKIARLFKKYFNRDVVSKYYEWAARNHEELVELVQKHRAEHNKWTGYFFREIRQREAVQGLPTLFDLEDMRKVMRQLEPRTATGRKNAWKKFTKFKKQAVYETDLEGHTKRIREIIMKVMDM